MSAAANVVANETSKENIVNDVAKGIGGVVGLIVLVLLLIGAFSSKNSAPVASGPTQQENDEAGVKAYFRHKHPNVPDQQVNDAAKRVVDEWNRATK